MVNKVYLVPYWKIKNSPPLANSLIDTNTYQNQILQHAKLPLYEFNLEVVIDTPTTIFPNYSDNPVLTNIMLKCALSNVGEKLAAINTDGSTNDGSTGCAFFVVIINYINYEKGFSACKERLFEDYLTELTASLHSNDSG
ncbi:hypothetical protein PPYR_01156 [Photinus pyralis]|uniref:Uncharacterized protein n=1 Tax=Photinus pyralis TaxID=7054 RepID=A0A5N4B3P1_PHOPY|nr:hypothetical protein PPYR_01156 [Photinus pyralis]